MNRPLGPGARAGWSQHSPFQPDRSPQGLKPAIHGTASTARLKSCPDTLPVSMRLSPRAAKEKSAEKGWIYDSKCACELPVYFTVFFKNDRVCRVVLSAPAG